MFEVLISIPKDKIVLVFAIKSTVLRAAARGQIFSPKNGVISCNLRRVLGVVEPQSYCGRERCVSLAESSKRPWSIFSVPAAGRMDRRIT